MILLIPLPGFFSMNFIDNLLYRYFEYLDAKGKVYNAFVGLLCTAAIGVFDIMTADAVNHSFMYLLPVAFVTWFSGLRTGLVLSLLCTGLWSVNNINTSLLITSWNIVSTSFFFAAIAAVMNKTRHLWENEKVLSRTDPLTGVKNLRAFSELVEYEISLALRDGLPFSLVYLDLDNFKAVNDTYGHTAGDKLLTSIAGSIVGNLRKTDVIGRLGGDEFAIFFPGTDQPSVQVVMLKISHELDRLMKNSQLPTTFSIGVITCSGGLYDFNELIGYADTLMYEVKHSGKNNIRYGTCPPAPREFPPRAPADR